MSVVFGNHAPTDQDSAAAPLVDAVEFARDALVEDGETPGEHLGARAEGEYAAAHYFQAQVPGYRGWQWCVVVAGAPDSTELTISETVLLPGEDSLLAPDWVPWVQRVAPGDLGPGDMLAAPHDDHRLVPAQIDTLDVDPIDADQVGQVAAEIGLGRKRLLSFDGRAEAAQRWYDGDYGPDTAMARNARHSCGTCGFYLPVAGALHGAFGVCANELSADGRVVSAEYGCGAHSDVKLAGGAGSPAYDAYDDGAVEIVTIVKTPAPDRSETGTSETGTSETDTAEQAGADAPAES